MAAHDTTGGNVRPSSHLMFIIFYLYCLCVLSDHDVAWLPSGIIDLGPTKASSEGPGLWDEYGYYLIVYWIALETGAGAGRSRSSGEKELFICTYFWKEARGSVAQRKRAI